MYSCDVMAGAGWSLVGRSAVYVYNFIRAARDTDKAGRSSTTIEVDPKII